MTAQVRGTARPPMRIMTSPVGHDFVKAGGTGSLHLSTIPLAFEVVVLLLQSRDLAPKSIQLGRWCHELGALKRVVHACVIAGSQCSWVEAAHQGVDGVGGRHCMSGGRSPSLVGFFCFLYCTWQRGMSECING
jgi:hypothetical protein